MSSTVVFDIETQNKISEMPGSDRVDQVRNLQVSCLSFLVLDSDRLLESKEDAARAVECGEMTTLWRDEDVDKRGPFEPLFRAFDEAELICSYNGLGFDHHVLAKHCLRRRGDAHLRKVHDPFSRLKETLGAHAKLDDLLKVNGLKTKTANGLAAIKMWRDGERDLLKTYCEQDVRALARMLALPELKLSNTETVVPNYLFGVASALAASRASRSLRLEFDEAFEA